MFNIDLHICKKTNTLGQSFPGSLLLLMSLLVQSIGMKQIGRSIATNIINRREIWPRTTETGLGRTHLWNRRDLIAREYILCT